MRLYLSAAFVAAKHMACGIEEDIEMGNPLEQTETGLPQGGKQNYEQAGLDAYRLSIGRLNALDAPGADMGVRGNFKGPDLVPGTTTELTVDVPVAGGRTEPRVYDVYVPEGYDGKKPLPLMFVFHGVSGGDGNGLMERETNMNEVADARQREGKGFIVVYPVAKTYNADPLGIVKLQDWNSPGAGLTDTRPGFDDVDYVKAMLDDLKGRVPVDPDAVYAAGFSSGGAFSRHLRGRLPGVFAGIASVHGTTLGTEQAAVPGDFAADISIVSSHDDMLPASGGRGLMTLPFGRISDSEPTRQFDLAARMNMCRGLPTVRQEGNLIISEFKPTQCHGFGVKQIYIDGDFLSGKIGGIIGRGAAGPAQHAWDGTGGGGWPVVGEKNRKIETSRLIADELLKYRKSSNDGRFFFGIR